MKDAQNPKPFPSTCVFVVLKGKGTHWTLVCVEGGGIRGGEAAGRGDGAGGGEE